MHDSDELTPMNGFMVMSNFDMYLAGERWKRKLMVAGYRIDESTEEERRVAENQKHDEQSPTDPPPSDGAS